MAELEERPSKLRKLEPLNGTSNIQLDGQAQFEDNLTSSELAIETQRPEIQNALASGLENGECERVSGGDDLAKAPTTNSEAPALSKNQLKKLRKKTEWEAGKDYRKQQKKTKILAKRAQRSAEKASRLALGLEPVPPKPRPTPSTQVPITLLLDCDFDEYMIDKEIMSLGQQITRSYSDNKHAKYRAHLVISSFGGRLKERYETVLSNHHLGWKGVTFSDKFFVEAAKDAHDKMIGPDGGKVAGALLGKEGRKQDEQRDGEAGISTEGNSVAMEEFLSESTEALGATRDEFRQQDERASNAEESLIASLPQSTNNSNIQIPSPPLQAQHIPIPATPQIVYLSSDSEHTLDSLSPYTTYVIGGIVDKNRHKGLCYKRANELGIPTAKLPIGEYMQMQSRTVLATNHVVEIMANWLDTGNWGEAFLKAIPKRKEAILRKNRDKQKKGPEKEGESEGEDDVGEENAMEMGETNNDDVSFENSETQSVAAPEEAG